MESIESLKKQLQEVNRDIEGMILAGAMTEKEQKTLQDAHEYRANLEDDLITAVREGMDDKGKADEPVIIGVMFINLN